MSSLQQYESNIRPKAKRKKRPPAHGSVLQVSSSPEKPKKHKRRDHKKKRQHQTKASHHGPRHGRGNQESDETTVLLDVNPLVRYPLLMLNLVLWFLGLLLFVTGMSLYVYSFAGEDGTDILSSIDSTSAIFTRVEIIVSLGGMSLFVVSFCGCVGALRENRFLLQLYSHALTALIAVSVVFAVVVFYVPGGMRKVLQSTLSESLVVHYRDSVDTEQLVDALQRGLKCCGVSHENFRDWNRNMYFNCTFQNPSYERCSVPHSCCRKNDSLTSGDVAASRYCGKNVLNMTDSDAWHKVNIDSCRDAVHRFIRDNVIMIGGGCVVIVILLSFIDMITNTVIDEIDVIRSIYDNIHAAASP
ncbi:tetraspanin-33-like isoform X1 [Dermacentor albipictus]|uniref:tetraspanin-33-like isoform X1 n=1 Tax=Dermacentor albipictus TaxID=60249 RepID=UPI0031FC34FC